MNDTLGTKTVPVPVETRWGAHAPRVLVSAPRRNNFTCLTNNER